MLSLRLLAVIAAVGYYSSQEGVFPACCLEVEEYVFQPETHGIKEVLYVASGSLGRGPRAAERCFGRAGGGRLDRIDVTHQVDQFAS